MGTTTAANHTVNESQRGELMTRLFRQLQEVRFNELYYQTRSSVLRRWSIGSNIVAALSASLALAGLLKEGDLWGWGSAAWKILTLLAALSAAIGPVLGWEHRAAQLEKAALGYSIVRDRIRLLLQDLKLSDLNDEHLAREQEIEGFRCALAALDEPASEATKRRCWNRTLEELPSDKAWTIV